MVQIPDRKVFDRLIDKHRVLVVLEKQDHELREKIEMAAKEAGLHLEGGPYVENPGPYLEKAAKEGPRPPTVVHIRQDISVSVDADEVDAAGGVFFKQQFFIGDKELDAYRRRPSHPPCVTQSERSVWLTGPDARPRLEKVLGKNDHCKGFLLASVYRVHGYEKDPSVRYAIDPWIANLEVNRPASPHAEKELLETLRKYFKLELEGERLPGDWFQAAFAEPGGDLYDFARELLKKLGDHVKLAFRSMPMQVKFAGLSPTDADYPTQQRATLSHINAEDMWQTVVGAPPAGGSPVIVFLIDAGVFVPGPDIVMDAALSVLIDVPVAGGYQPGCTPLGGNRHGTQMAGVVGAVWGLEGMAGVAGAPVLGIRHVSLRVTSLSTMSDALEYAAQKTVAAAAKGIVVFGLDVLYYYALSKCFGLTAETLRFETVLNTVTLPANDLVVVMPAGNQDLDDPNSPSGIAAVPPNILGTLIVAATNEAATARLNDPSPAVHMASRGGPGLSLAAPGANVYTTFNTVAGSPAPHYGRVWGTSFAAAHVAGVVALTRYKKPALTATAVKTLMMLSVNPITGGVANVGAGLMDGAQAVN